MPGPIVDDASGLVIQAGRLNDLQLYFPAIRREPGVPRVADFADLSGAGLGDALERVGWRYQPPFVRVDAIAADLPQGAVAATGWACLVRLRDGRLGINVSYGVHPDYRGLRLAALLAVVAVSEALVLNAARGLESPEHLLINVQTRRENEASLSVCRQLGIPEDPEAGFVAQLRPWAPGSQAVEFVGFREPLIEFWDRVTPMAAARIPGYRPGDLTSRVASSLWEVEPNDDELAELEEDCEAVPRPL